MKLAAELALITVGVAWGIARGAEEALRIHVETQTALVKVKSHLLIDRLVARPIEFIFLRLDL